MNVWSLAEQVLIKITKSIHRRFHERIIAAIWRCFRGKDWTYVKKERAVIKMIGRSRRFAIEMFSIYSDSVLSTRQKDFIKSLIDTLYNIVRLNDDQLLQESLATHIHPFILNHLSYTTIDQLSTLIKQLVVNITLPNSRVRRSAVTCLVSLCQNNAYHYNLIELISESFINLVKDKCEESSDSQDLLTFEEKRVEPTQFQIKTSSSATLQGVLYGFSQLIKIVALRESYKVKNPLEKYFTSILNITTQSLNLKGDNNVIVSALELLHEILLNQWNPRIFDFIYNDKNMFNFIEKVFDDILFQSSSNTSARVLIVSCLCDFTQVMTPSIEQYIRHRFENIIALILENDQILRGQAYYFIGCYLKRILIYPLEGLNDEEQVYNLFTKLLKCIHEERSSNVIKMACESLHNCISSLLYSEYAWIALEIINSLIMIPDSSQTMIKSKIFTVLSSINYNIVHELENDPYVREKCHMSIKYDHTSFQNEVINFLVKHLEDHDQHIRKDAVQSLVKMIPNIKLERYWGTNNQTLHPNKIYILNKVSYNNEMSHLIWLLAPKVYDDDGQFMKSFYYLLRTLIDEGYDIPYQFADLLLNQIQTLNFRNDIESYLDIIYILSCIVRKHKYDLKPNTAATIFDHVLKSMEILSKSINPKPTVDIRKSKDTSMPIESLFLSDIKNRITEAYSLSLTSYHRTLFDTIVFNIVQSLKYVIERCGYESFINIDSILSNVRFDLFPNNSDIVINLLKVLVESCIKEGYKDILYNFERIFIACKHFCKLSTSLRIISRTYILISDLVNYGIQYRTVDGDLSFFEHTYSTFIKTESISSLIEQLNVYHLLYLLTVMSKKHVKLEPIINDSFYNGINKTFELHWEHHYNNKAFKRICRLLFNPESKDDDFGEYTLKLKELFINNLVLKLPQHSSIEMLLTIISHIQDDEELCQVTYKNIFTRLFEILNIKLIPEEMNMDSLMTFIEMIPPIYLHKEDLEKVINIYISNNEKIDMNKASIMIKFIDKIQLKEQDSQINSLKENHVFLNLIFRVCYQIVKDIKMIKDNETLFHSTLNTIELIYQLLQNCKEQDSFSPLKSLFIESKEFNHYIDLIDNNILQSSLIIERLSLLFASISYYEPIVTILNNLKDNQRWYTKQLRRKLGHSISLALCQKISINDNLMNHLLSESVLSTIVEQIDDQNISKSLKTVILNHPDAQKTILNYIYHFVQYNKTLTIHDSIKLLKLIMHLEPSMEVLDTIVQNFISNAQHISSILVAEEYILKVLINNNSFIDPFIHKYSHQLRKTFYRSISQKFDIKQEEKYDLYNVIIEKFNAALLSGDKREICTSINTIAFNFYSQFGYNYNAISFKTRTEIESMYPNLENLYETEKESVGSLILFEPDEVQENVNVINEENPLIDLKWDRIIEFIHLINLSFDQFGCSLFSFHNHRVQSYQLFSISIYALKEIIKSHRLGKFHSSFDMIILMQLLKNMFHHLEVQDNHLKTIDLMRDLVYNMYHFILIIIRTNNVITIDEQSFESIDNILQLFYQILHEQRIDPNDSERYIILTSCLQMLSEFIQSSSSLELNAYPFQNDPINFDYNHDPVHVLETFEYMINTYPPRFPETFEKIWRQIIIGVDPKFNIPTIATSDKIKLHSFRALSSLILSVREGKNANIDILIDPNPNLLPFIVSDTRKLQENYVILWKSLHISSLIDEYLDLLSIYLDKYLNFTISSPELGKECLRSIVLLSDLFVPNQRTNVYSLIMKGLESQQEIYKEDILMKMQLLLGLCKLSPVMFSLQREQMDVDILKQRILKILNHHIINQPSRKQLPQNDDKSILSIPNNIILLCIAYLFQIKDFFDLDNELITNYINNIENIETNYFVPTDITKRLAKICSFVLRQY